MCSIGADPRQNSKTMTTRQIREFHSTSWYSQENHVATASRRKQERIFARSAHHLELIRKSYLDISTHAIAAAYEGKILVIHISFARAAFSAQIGGSWMDEIRFDEPVRYKYTLKTRDRSQDKSAFEELASSLGLESTNDRESLFELLANICDVYFDLRLLSMRVHATFEQGHKMPFKLAGARMTVDAAACEASKISNKGVSLDDVKRAIKKDKNLPVEEQDSQESQDRDPGIVYVK